MTSEELEKSIQEIWEMFKETDQKFKETDRRFKETDRRFKETEKRFRETDKKIERVSAIVGDLGGKWGQFVEGLVVPTVKELFQERGIPVERVYRHIEATRNGRHFEGDILLTNKTHGVLVEVKSTLTVDDVNAHIKRVGELKEFFPEYAHLKLMGAVAAIVFH
ncbi:MAG: DUF3782 domain-containing protein, partial [Calditrichaeota bacterium]